MIKLFSDDASTPQPSPWVPERDPVTLAVLGKLAEELAEAGAIVARCLIQGIGECEPVTGEPNREALEDELADVIVTLTMAIEHFALDSVRMAGRQRRKHTHLLGWHRLLRGGR